MGYHHRRTEMASRRPHPKRFFLFAFPFHSDPLRVYSVVLDVNRKQACSGSMDGTVRIWSLLNGTCLHTLTGHTSLVGLLGLSPSYLVSAAADSTLRIWDPSTGELKHTLAAHTGAITCFQHDEFKVLSGSDGNLKMWNVKDGTVVRDLLTGITGVWQVVFEGRWCVSASNRNDSTVLDVWDFGKECDGGWVGEPASGVYDDDSWSEYEEDEEGEDEGARNNGMGDEHRGESGDMDARERDGEEQDGMVVDACVPVDLARLREKRSTMYDPRAGKGCPTAAHAGRMGSQSEMMELDHNIEGYPDVDDNFDGMELVPSDSEHSEVEVAGRMVAVPDRPTHPLPHSYHHHHHHHHHHHSHAQPQTPSRHLNLREKQCGVPSGGDNAMEYERERERARARPGSCSSAPVLGASTSSTSTSMMMMTRRHRDDRHLVRLALDDVFPGGGDDYVCERPRFLRELEERAEREESRGAAAVGGGGGGGARDGDGDGDGDGEDEESERNGEGSGGGGSMARWGVLEGRGSSGPTLTGVEGGGEVCCEPSTLIRSMAPAAPPLRRRDKGEGEGEGGEGDREFVEFAGESSLGSGSSTMGMGMRKQTQTQLQLLQQPPLQYEGIPVPVPVLPVLQETPTRHRIVKSMSYGYGYGQGQVKRRRN